MAESNSWGILRVALKNEAESRQHSIHITRIENEVSAGALDTHLCFDGYDCWLEGKYLTAFPSREQTLVQVGLRDSQQTFATKRLLAGGKSFLWCHVGANNKRGVGSGWFLITFDCVDKIRRCRSGMAQAEFMLDYHATAREMAASLLNRLKYLGRPYGSI